MRVTQVRNWLPVWGVVFLMLPASTLAGPAGVTVSGETDRDTYSIGSLSTSPVIVRIYAENNTDEKLMLTEAYWKPSAYAEFGSLRVGKELRPGEVWAGQLPTAEKKLAFLPAPSTLRVYQNVVTDPTDFLNVTKQVGTASVKVLGIPIGPHERRMVARVEVYLNDFVGAPVPDAYIVTMRIHRGSIWNWRTQEEAASGLLDEGFQATAFIKLR